MDFNEYEKKLITSLGFNVEEFDIEYFNDYLINLYWDIDSEDKLQQLMLAVSYLKRLLQKVCEKRNIPYDANAQIDINAVLESCKSKYEQLKDLDVKKAIDEVAFSKSIDTVIDGYSYEQVHTFASYYGFFYKEFHRYMVDHVLPLVNNYFNFYYEVEEPKPSDPFLDAIFSSDSSGEPAVFDDDWKDEWKEWEDWEELNPSQSVDSSYEVSSTPVEEKKELSNEEIVELLTFLNSVFDIAKVHSSLAHNDYQLNTKANQRKLEEFHSNTEFMEKFAAMIEHDKETHTYRFHGTTCLEDAKSICEQGFGVMRDDLDSTSYKELTMDEVIIHERGFGGEIGRDAYIIIDEPKGVQILESLQEGEQLNIAGSGLQGLDAQATNIVRSKYIVGYVDKRNKEIVFNPEYYDYERFAQYTNKKS